MSGVLAVILSAAKDLARRTQRSFAEFTLSAANGLRMTGILSKCLSLTTTLALVWEICYTAQRRDVRVVECAALEKR